MQDELHQGCVVCGFGVGEPGVEKPVPTDTNKSGKKCESGDVQLLMKPVNVLRLILIYNKV